ncbi:MULTISPECIES: FAD-linked oxidase C-terminal domain-containing protein [unclassified Lysobacter]|uniref:FAD-binding oxidoreductase n=1 Tax=unclassified Lysobacter TaxID=2635362 RepID=UPI001BED152A|nr:MULTISPECIES: FAD-linked oxidase C-terminal domain-containing protein [unclassified Lysobacter]MBT2747887.1 FAD-binding protein [Lysobacter sp. ISL-42]MBT2753773.1 FAD-binding protein [Lysobacter sp. ISL-50]MBT2779061.1 FAD-binding protein [Lysobacter sp. ISL-54]
MSSRLPPALHEELAQLLGDAWLTDPGDRLSYAYDNSRRQALPDAVALPRNREQVQALVRACRRHRVPVVARGRGTNTTGASVPIAGGVVVSFERMNRIVEIRPGDRCAIVEPGVLNGDLQTALKAHGLFWPPDPTSAAFSTVGGNLACNAGGPRAVKYGASRDNVLALTAVTGAGELIVCGTATTKGSTGYDLHRLLVGSEGTLALIVEASLRLTPSAPARAAVRAIYRDVSSAALAVARLMAQPVTPSMLEFMDAHAVQLARDVGGADLPHEAGALLMIEADGDAQTLPYSIEALKRAAAGDGLLWLDDAADEAAREKLWAARKALSPSLRTLAPGKINEDVVVPVSRIPQLVDGVQALSREFDLPIVCFGHAGNGNLHVNLLYDPADESQNQRGHRAMNRVFELALALGGTLSGEHGIGLAKREFMPQAVGVQTLALMRQLKTVFDPDGILNPGKLLPDE